MNTKIAIHMVETGDLKVSFFLIAASGLPRRASCSLVNFSLRRFCSGVWAILEVWMEDEVGGGIRDGVSQD